MSRLLKSSFLAFGKMASTLSGIAIASALSHSLLRSDYATYQQTLLTFTIVAPILAMGLPTAALYFLPKNPLRASTTVLEMLLLLALTGGMFAFFLRLGGANWVANHFQNPKLEESLMLFSGYALCVLPTILVPPVLVARNATSQVAIFSTLIAMIKISCVAIPVWLIHNSSIIAIQGIMSWALIALVVSIVFLSINLPSIHSNISLASARELCNYGIPLSLATIVASFNRNIDKLLVSKFLRPSEAAVFINGAMEIPFIGIVTGAVSSVLAAEFSVKFEDDRRDEIMPIWRNAVKKTAAILFPIGAIFFVFAELILVTLFSAEYIASAVPFRIYLCLLPLRAFQGGIFLRMAGKTKELLFFSFTVTIFNVISTYFMVPIFGMNGAALATVISVGLVGFPFGIWMTERVVGIRIWTWIPYSQLGLYLIVPFAILLGLKYSLSYFGVNELLAFLASVSFAVMLVAIFLKTEGVSLVNWRS